MEHASFANNAFSTARPDHKQSVAVNSEYAAIVSNGEILVISLKCEDREPQYLSCPASSGWNHPIFSLSPTSSERLAVSHGSTAYIYDLDSLEIRYTIPGNGRTITSLALAENATNALATGHIDGSICLWNVANLSRPSQQLNPSDQSCDVLGMDTVDGSYLASIHGTNLHVHYGLGAGVGLEAAYERGLLRQVCNVNDESFASFAWHLRKSGYLVASTTDGKLFTYDVSNALQDAFSIESLESSDDDSDCGVFGRPDDVRKDLQPLSTLDLEATLTSITPAGDTIFYSLAADGRTVLLCQLNETASELRQLWHGKFNNAAEALQLVRGTGPTLMVGVGHTDTESLELAEDVATIVNAVEHRPPYNASTYNQKPENFPLSPGDRVQSAVMNPLSIGDLRLRSTAFAKTSKQLQHMRQASRHRKNTVGLEGVDVSVLEPPEVSVSPRTQVLHSELDNPIFEPEDDFGSPMPFLSPGIPSNRNSPNDIPMLDDSVITPPKIHDRAEDVSVASELRFAIADPDTDDSDDETFADGILGGTTFLPGGINVPLPKACGALFAPNGQLLTFFPPKPRAATAARKEEEEDDATPERPSRSDKRSKLFPTFGNLGNGLEMPSDDSDSEDSRLVEGAKLRSRLRFRSSFQPASFPSQHSWKALEAAAHPGVYSEPPRHRVIVNVQEVTGVSSLGSAQRTAANHYRVLCRPEESGAELCEYNSSVAETAGMEEVAHIWQLLAMLLGDRFPFELLSSSAAQDDLLVTARQAKLFTRNDSGVNLSASNKHNDLSGKLQWTDHPFGSAWLVRRILEWMESRADVQTLACICAVLSEAQQGVPLKRARAEHLMLTHLPTYSPVHNERVLHVVSSKQSRQPVPILRTHSATITSLHESPAKVPQSGALSSSLTSQASLNYSDSSATPPFSSPLLSRQTTRLSASGASSPEFQRGSFTTAAKYYASSLSEKFRYGSSPPVKKDDTSPTTSTELPSSLPGGSWPGKSVSFASTTTESSTHGKLSGSARRRDVVEDNGYDSDKTIEDNSLPQTPKRSSSNVALNLHNQAMFADESCGFAKAKKLFPNEMSNKVAIWIEYYAEQLRCWELLAQASELEKVFGLTNTSNMVLEAASMNTQSEAAILPKTRSKQRRVVCEICHVATNGLLEVCPACLHASHLNCLEEFCVDLPLETFTCPSGCDCSCANLPFLVQDIVAQSPQRPTFKKKTSFTDPRRWRARIEGDSW